MSDIMTKGFGKKPYITIIFLLPAILLYSVFLIWPIFQSAWYSLFDYSGIADASKTFLGLKNYIEMFTDPGFGKDMLNTLKLILISFAVHIPLAFGLALIVSKGRRGSSLFKTIFFIPTILPTAAVALMWKFIYNPNWGVLSAVIREIGFENFNLDWLGNRGAAMYAVSFVNAWVSAGESMIIFATGMSAISPDLNEAASIDGATGFKRLIYITIPLLKETFRMYFILLITGALKAFNLIFVMTQGGPNGATEVPTMMVYFNGFKYYNYGYASAVAFFILALGFLISFIINKAIKTESL